MSSLNALCSLGRVLTQSISKNCHGLMGFGYACNRKMAASAALRMLLLPVLVDVLFLYAQIWTLSPKRGGACRANYSTHTCAGVDVNHRANHDQHLQDGTCLFENVCIFNGELTYTVHPGISDAGSVRVPRLPTLCMFTFAAFFLATQGTCWATMPGLSFRPC